MSKSHNILLQPLLPIIFREAAGDTTFNDALQECQSKYIARDAMIVLTLKRTVGVT